MLSVLLLIKINNGGTTPASGNGYTIAEKSEGNYTLTLDNFTGSSIFLRRGTWEVVLKGTNTVTNDEDNLTPLSIWNDIYVTVRGTGELNLISK